MYVEVQLITASQGVWLVGVTDTGAKAHDFFPNKDAAMEFVAGFGPYHGAKLVEAKSVDLAPETTEEKVIGYRADHASCNCPDFVYRGGSYMLPNGQKCCKHMLAVQPQQQTKPQVDVNPFACFEE